MTPSFAIPTPTTTTTGKGKPNKGRTNRSKYLVSPYRVRRIKTGVSDEELRYIYHVYSNNRLKVTMKLSLWIGESV